MQPEWTTDHREWYRTVYLKSDHWKELRARKISEHPSCQRCPSTLEPDVHHVNYKNLFDVETSDLLTLCRNCHDLEHTNNGMTVREKPSFDNYFPKYALDKISKKRRFDNAVERWSTSWSERKDMTNKQRLTLRLQIRNRTHPDMIKRWESTAMLL